ncbi:unnamed protein product [Prorocentrum cordatum]|uniref:HTH OST-type domain-containing protein n=1 Tax=Prorocentrum cordatum TaxID=2364126 RepID=A0ABN9TSQ4_9DINO|nr:unnamed protein product [Polarella glacialis]
MGVEDVHDVGDGTPLYKLFSPEDWALHSLRCELFLLAAAYKKDVDDPERPGIHEDHITFYFGKYFKKSLVPKHYGKDSLADLLTMVKDTVSVDPENGVLTLKVEDDKPADYFLKKQEENRRERQRRIDAGDETARLDFSALTKQKEQAEKQAAARAQAAQAAPQAPAAAATMKAPWKTPAAAATMKAPLKTPAAAAGAATGAAPAAKAPVPTGKMVAPKGQGKGAAPWQQGGSKAWQGQGPKGGGKAWQPGKQGGKKW